MQKLSLAEQLLYSTIKLTSLSAGAPKGTGTGFFFSFFVDGKQEIPVILTNNHVINGCDAITATCHLADGDKPSGKYVNCMIHINEHSVCRHPDPNIDLCAIFFGEILNQAANASTPIFFVKLDAKLIPEDDEWQYFDAIEEVMMIGCPNGISDETNNLPISRKGITASSLAKNYNGKNEFMVDMACFPGSSGSPVFIYNPNGYTDRKTNNYLMGATRIKLVGILYAGPLITNRGNIVLGQPPTVQVAAMMHLGSVIKSSQITMIHHAIKEKFPT